MSRKAVPATIENGTVSIVDADDPTKKAQVSDQEPAESAAGVVARLVGGGTDAKLIHELLYRILSELREMNHKPPLPGCERI